MLKDIVPRHGIHSNFIYAENGNQNDPMILIFVCEELHSNIIQTFESKRKKGKNDGSLVI